MYEALLVILLITAIGLIVLVMLQQGKGAGMGASFGAGASSTLFGSSGSGNFMTRMTAILATVFFVVSLILGNLSGRQTSNSSKWDEIGGAEVIEKKVNQSGADSNQQKPVEPSTAPTDVPN